MQAAHRPTGITVLAAWYFISGIWWIVYLVSILFGASPLPTASANIIGGVLVWFLLRVPLSVLSIIFGYGAWKLRPWAWMLGVVLEAISLALVLSSSPSLPSSILGLHLFDILIDVLILYYLFIPKVRRAFRMA